MQAKAEARYLRVTPQKARLVIDLIRGQRAGDAINILRTTNKRVAPSIEKVLRSAIANAENRSNDVDVDKLIVIEAYVNEGPRMKRVRPAPMGRAYQYKRRMSHIIVKVGDETGPFKKAISNKAASKKAATDKVAASKRSASIKPAAEIAASEKVVKKVAKKRTSKKAGDQ